MLIDDSGTGKAHLPIGLGSAACEQRRRVRYATCQLANELVEAAVEHPRPTRRPLRTLDLLRVEELGYVQLAAAALNCCSGS